MRRGRTTMMAAISEKVAASAMQAEKITRGKSASI
jgi:hypothetical protein